ncbi:hypothetical protein [Kitasatospora sp. NPDC093806]|uniref:hypothetical protein n=1 Tax=Kitasatospora sp. NPDC093806 TaxID=3155075 RepID=UPI00343B00B1
MTLRPLFPDTGKDTSYWRQAWRSFVQRDSGRLMAINDLSDCVLGVGAPVGAFRNERLLTLERTTGSQDRDCTAWAPAPPKVAPWADLPRGTGRVRTTAQLYERRSRVIEFIEEPYLLEVPGRTLAPGTVLDSFAFDEFSRTGWYRQEKEGDLRTFTEGFEGPDRVRKTFHRLAGSPGRYVDADEVDVHYVEPVAVAHTNFPARLLIPVEGSTQLLRTNHRLSSGHPFFNQPVQRREGTYAPRYDSAGLVASWEKSWIADNDTSKKVFLSFDGHTFVDEMDVTWVTS